jgi:hypothetical protein
MRHYEIVFMVHPLSRAIRHDGHFGNAAKSATLTGHDYEKYCCNSGK